MTRDLMRQMEQDLERVQKLLNEVENERFTRLDRALLKKAKDNIVVVMTADERDPARQTMTTGRPKTLERLGLASERRPGVWELDVEIGSIGPTRVTWSLDRGRGLGRRLS